MKKLTLLLSLALATSAIWPTQAQEQAVAAEHAIVIEAQTGKILFEQDAQEQAEIASISKLISAYVIYEALEAGHISLTDQVAISDYAYELTQVDDLANIPLENDHYPLEDLLEAALISSANSAMIALAEHVAGSEPAFVDLMTKTLTDMGITGAKLVNSTGLNNDILGDNRYPGSAPDAENQLSALDLAKVLRRLILDHPEVLALTSQTSYLFNGESYPTTNKMLAGMDYARPGVDGLKTGTTDLAGASFAGTALEDGMRLISVVLNATEENPDPDNRFAVTDQLLTQAFADFTTETLVTKGQTVAEGEVSIFNGKAKTVDPIAETDLTVVVKKDSAALPGLKMVPTGTNYPAPIAAGTPLAKLQVDDQNLIGSGYVAEKPEVQMVSPSDVAQASWPVSWWNHLVRFVTQAD